MKEGRGSGGCGGYDGKRDNSFLRKDRVRERRRGEGGEGKIRLLAYPSYWGRIK